MAGPRTALAVLFLFILTNCERAPAPAPNAAAPGQSKNAPSADDFGDVFIGATIGEASNLIPFLSSDASSGAISDAVFASLLTVDKDMNIIPGAAKRWEVSPDGLTLTFHLHDTIKWHDGVPFTAHDLVYQYQMMIHPDVPSGYKDVFMQMASAVAPDDHTFVVTFREPFAPALARLSGMTGLPRHLLKDVKPVDLIKSPLARNPVGTGPWIFEDWKTQSQITLRANPDYYDGRPWIGRSVTRVIPDMATQFLELKSGGIDMMDLRPLQHLKQTDSEYFKEKYRKYRYLANAYTYLGYNLKRPLFADKRVRQAISYAINKKEVIDGVLLGLGVEATGPFKPGHWAHNPHVKKYEYNPARAKELLAEAGWRDSDNDGVLDKDGKRFEFEILTNQGNAERAKTAEIIQQRLKAVGIEVKARPLEWSAFINNFVNTRDFDALILGWTLGLDPDQYIIWHSSMTGEHQLNHVSYKNAEVDELLEKGRRVFDQDKRREYYFRFQEILAEDQPYTFLYVPEALPIVSARVRGIEPGLAGIGYNFEKWWIPKGEHLNALAP
ncbi:MAG: peptide-binding protein [Nitrospinae bacterium]|nr:peptide-binding protein [Nitrospinota bacterium]